ncbi:exported hypothetical protein [Alphaproteobacteria bacterium]
MEKKMDKSILCRKISCLLLLQFFAVCAASADTAQTPSKRNLYFQITGGTVLPRELRSKIGHKDDYYAYNNLKPRSSMVYGGNLGYQFYNNLRGEVAVLHLAKQKFENNIEHYDEIKDSINVNLDEHLVRQEFSSTACFVNFTLHSEEFGKFKPYFTAGVGGSRNEAGDHNMYDENNYTSFKHKIKGKTSWYLAWNLGAGMGLNIRNRLDVDLGYKYLDLNHAPTSDIAIEADDGIEFKTDPINPEFTAHAILLGIRFYF